MPDNNNVAINKPNAFRFPGVKSASDSGHTMLEYYAGLPRYVPMPSGTETERYSGLKRGRLNTLILPCEANGYRPPVKSISLKPPGALKGKRLIVLASLLSFLAKLENEQTSEAVVASEIK